MQVTTRASFRALVGLGLCLLLLAACSDNSVGIWPPPGSGDTESSQESDAANDGDEDAAPAADEDDASENPQADEDLDDPAEEDPPAEEEIAPEIEEELEPEPEEETELDPEPEEEIEQDSFVETITVMTLNLQNISASPLNVDQRTQTVIDFINARTPDIVLLQEVSEAPLVDNRGTVIKEGTGYNCLQWRKTHGALGTNEGIAVLSRATILNETVESADLPHPELFDSVTRAVLGMHVSTMYGTFQVYVTHLMTGDNETERADQAAKILEVAANRYRGLTGFFGGDLNTTPDALANQVFRGEAEHGGQTGNFIDVWAATRGNDSGYTYPSSNPTRRIDYIYMIPGDGPTLTPIDCERVLTLPSGNAYASDHVGVLCRFAVAN